MNGKSCVCFFALRWAKISKQCEKSALVFLWAFASRLQSFRKDDPTINSLGLIFQVEGRILDGSSGSAAVQSGRWLGFEGAALIDWMVWLTSPPGERESCRSWRRCGAPLRHTCWRANTCARSLEHKRTSKQTNGQSLKW